jgi:hypothetical protein
VPITIFCLIGKSDQDHVLFSIIGYRDSHSRRCRDLWCQASEGSALERGNPNNLTPTFRTNRHRFRVSIFGYKRAAMGLGMSGHISNRFPPKSWSGASGYPSREFYKTHGDRRWNSPPCTQRSPPRQGRDASMLPPERFHTAWVKSRTTHFEHMLSALPPKADIRRESLLQPVWSRIYPNAF